jgi:acetoin utilization protein AcuB
MSKPIPTIQKYMTTTPHSIGGDQSLATAERVMREHKIRHLPVLSGGKLLGVLTDRDLKFVETFPDVDPSKLTAAEAMIEEPYTVHPDASLDAVAGTMAAEKYGSALVVQNGHVVGIFTTVDACRALAELLTTRLQK